MPQQLPPSFTPDFYRQFQANVTRKYDIAAEEARAKTTEAQTNAATLPGLREAQGFNLRAGGQLDIERAGTESARRYMKPEWLGGAYDQMLSGGLLPPTVQAPTAPGTGAPGAQAAPAAPAAPAAAPTAPAAERPPINFLQLPSIQEQQRQLPAAPAARADITPAPPAPPLPLPTGNLLPTASVLSPEQLAQQSQNAATRRRQQAQAQPLPSLVRPTTGATAVKPLYDTGTLGFRRGTANVPRGYAEGDADILGFRRPLGLMNTGRGSLASSPMPTPGFTPSFGPGPTPSQRPPAPAPTSPAFAATGAWPSGAPRGFGYDPSAGYGVENLGGIVDAATRMINPERFNAAVESFRPSENIEDRRGVGGAPTTSTLGDYLNMAGGLLNPAPLASDIWHAVVGDTPAPQGSLPQQLGYNDISGGTSSGILGHIFGSSVPPESVTEPTFAAIPTPAPSENAPSPEDQAGYRKGTANVKTPPGKGGKAKGGKADKAPSKADKAPSKADKAPSGSPKGLEALLPLLAAMQGGGAGGPPAGPPAAPAPTQGLKKGSANVKGKGKSSQPSTQPAGLEAMLPALMAASRGGGAVGPQAADGLPPAMAPGAAALPGFARGDGDVPMPNYPFGAGYLFGAQAGTTAVPGEGSGSTDTVPAMLAPHEAVLNRAAADMLGRGLIAALNAKGVRQMAMMRRGVSPGG